MTLANQLARVHQCVRFSVAAPGAELLTPPLCDASSLGGEIQRLMERIDPYGLFQVTRPRIGPADISIGVGSHCRGDLSWYIGYDRSNAELAESRIQLRGDSTADLRGAGLAALLGASAAFKEALNLDTVPRIVSAWNLAEGADADRGPSDFAEIDVGQGLIVGAGAVAASVVYWLLQWGNNCDWTIVDGDVVELHNTNRCLLFFPNDAGWMDHKPSAKSDCLRRYLPGSTAHNDWYDQSSVSRTRYDTILLLANERDVRTLISKRNDPVQFQATTGRSWLSQLHRHIAGRDDCARCRMADIKEPLLACSEAPIKTVQQPNRPDAALPFLSAASGLMLVSALQHLQRGEFGEEAKNTWRWDFRSTHRMSSSGRYECRDDCSTQLSTRVQEKMAGYTRWRNPSWKARA